VTIKKKESERQMKTITTKLSSSHIRATTTIFLSALLLLGMAIAILPSIATVKAAGPTLTLSATSGRSDLRDHRLWGSVDPYMGANTIIITGTGFEAGQDDITMRIADISVAISTTAGNQLFYTKVSIPGSSLANPLTGTNTWTNGGGNTTSNNGGPNYSGIFVTGGYVKADGSGNFKVTFAVPQLKAGQYNIWAVYTPSGGSPTNSPPTVFTVNAAIAVVEEQNVNLYGADITGVFNAEFTFY